MKDNLIDILKPESGQTILIYDVHASESGALAILDDLYNQIAEYEDKSVKWVFVVSTPLYKERDNIKVVRYPWVKKSWLLRWYFDNVTTRTILKQFKPDKVFSLQNKGIPFYHKEQLVYLHLPFVLTDHRFDIRKDGRTLWLYQNVISHSIFRSLRKVDRTIVQTQWMKDALVRKAGVDASKIILQQPDITTNNILKYEDRPETRKTFFYPATAFTYKNHMTLLKALNEAVNMGLKDYEVILTIREDENKYTQSLYDYATKHSLNVRFNGPVSREEVFKLYARSVLLFPSYVESFGLPLLEARMTGTHVVASNCPFCKEILAGYEKAYFFDEMDYNTIAKHIVNLQKING